MDYIAHRRKDSSVEQSIRDHLTGTAQRAAQFAQAFHGEQQARLCGLCHDAGKYSAAFQQRIRGAALRVDHATAGAKELNAAYPGFGYLLAYCVAGHHGGLPQGGDARTETEADSSLAGRLKRSVAPYDAFFREMGQPELPSAPPALRTLGKGGFSVSMYVRMLYSCLVDADFLDTEAFMRPDLPERGAFDSLDVLLERLNRHLASFRPDRPINQKRSEILSDCRAAAAHAPGLFSLTVPTGGGKTLSSLAFALEHAQRHGLERVIYVIPYTTIIEQNAQAFAQALGRTNVLEHHAGFDFEDSEDHPNPLKLASENWDAPLIVTTNVQFFESLFAHKPSRCRKLHSLARSVIVLDEAQMLPTDYLLPCVRALSELVINYASTVVLMSATQPALAPYFPNGLAPHEITRDAASLYRFFRRTRIVPRGVLSDEALALELREAPQALAIVNTRAHAKALFEALNDPDAFHLSTDLCPAHRRRLISEIRARLQSGQPCRVISTQLIEAGVDVDFPVVYRALTGVDSLVQSAGRCNREGRVPLREVYAFEPERDWRLPHALKRPIEVTRGVFRRHEDVLSPEAIRDYFGELYRALGAGGLDVKDVVADLEAGYRMLNFNFPDVARRFKLIEEDTRPVVIPYDDAARTLIARLRREGPSRALLRQLQPYSVSVRSYKFQALAEASALEAIGEGGVLLEEALYDLRLGLKDPPPGGSAILL